MVGRSGETVAEPGQAASGTGPGEHTAGSGAPEPGGGATAGEVLGGYLRARAAEFLRALRAHTLSAGTVESAARTAEAVEALRAAARRLSGTLHTYRPLLDAEWADHLRAELSWLSGSLAREYAYAHRLDRLLGSLHRLSGGGGTGRTPPPPSAPAGRHRERPAGERAAGGRAGHAGAGEDGALPVGAARAGALLDRQLTLSRTRAHTAALQALGSARFHAVADAVALLASEPRLPDGVADRPAVAGLAPLAGQARRRLSEAVAALPLSRAGAPYNAEALARSLAGEARQDAAWHHVRVLLRLHRYAQEVLGPYAEPDARLLPAGAALERHRDAAEAAAAVAAAAGTPRIAPATAYALGVLHADQRHEVEAARFVFGRVWDRGTAGPT
ncbi:CHAD domain-containing protein [Streptomyces cacaoi]